jgi:hypothetical protein
MNATMPSMPARVPVVANIGTCSVADLCAIVAKIEAKGASLRILARSLALRRPPGG